MKFGKGCSYVLRYVIPFWGMVALLIWLVVK